MHSIIIGIFGTLLAALMLFFVAFFGGTLVYFLWNYMAPVYLTFLPAQYLHLPWWHCICLLWLITLINPFRNNISVGKK